jgi:hypothetical protein
MTTDVVLTRWNTGRSEHETAVRGAVGAARGAVRGNVGYEEWPRSPMIRREVARVGVALILAFGDPLDIGVGEEGPTRSLRAFVVGNQSRASLSQLAGHQRGVQVELSDAGAVALFGQVGELNDSAIPIEEVLGGWGIRLVDRLANTASWDERFGRGYGLRLLRPIPLHPGLRSPGRLQSQCVDG